MIPSVGDEVCVTVKAERAGQGYVAGLPYLPKGWQCEFRPARKDEDTTLQGTYQLGWVFDVQTRQRAVVVTGRERGFLPISRRMRRRYRSAIADLLAWFDGGTTGTRPHVPSSSASAKAASEVKGMYSRCFMKNQADWCAVWDILERPTNADARERADLLGELARAWNKGNMQDADGFLARVYDLGFPQALGNAAKRLEAGESPLEGGRLVGSATTKSDGGNRAVADVPRSVDGAKIDWANATHAELLQSLNRHLRSFGLEVYENTYIDALCELPKGECLIFEAKSITEDNELAQVRSAVAQLYEYRYRERIGEATLWLLLSRRPTKERWLLRYLEADRDIRVLWVEDGRLAGPSLAQLSASLSSAIAGIGQG